MPSVLITGANRGIGLEFARQYAADGWLVTCTCRDPAKADALLGLSGNVATYTLDVTDAKQVTALAGEIGYYPYDLLINNAGVYGPRGLSLGEIDYDAWRAELEVNALAPLRVAAAFADSVAASELKTMAFISSRMGSIGENTSGGAYIYRSSKACLNAAVKSLSIDLAPRGVTAVALHPGWVRTDMGGPSAMVSVEDSVGGLRRVLAGLTPSDSGRFFSYDGTEIPW